MDLLVSFKPMCQLMLLSNGTTKLDSDLKILNIFDHFDQIFNASVIGIAKPDVKCFKHVVDRIGMDPSEILFIDDRAENIIAALGLGMQTHHYLNFTGLKSFLNSQN